MLSQKGEVVLLVEDARWVWISRSACKTEPIPEFVIERHTIAEAQAVANDYCRGCPVMDECYEWATGEPEFDGIAGGAWWKHNGRKRRITRLIAPRKLGKLQGRNRNRVPTAQVRHVIEEISPSLQWKAVCGARCTATEDKREASVIARLRACPACERVMNGNTGKPLRRNGRVRNHPA